MSTLQNLLVANHFTTHKVRIGLGVNLLIQSREVAGSNPAGSTFCFFFFIFFGIFLLHECNRSAPALRVGLVPGRITAGTPPCFDVSGGRRIYGRYVPPAPGVPYLKPTWFMWLPSIYL